VEKGKALPVKGVSELQEERRNGPQIVRSSLETIAIKLWVALLVSKACFFTRGPQVFRQRHIYFCAWLPGKRNNSGLKVRPIRVEPRERLPSLVE